MAENAKNSIYKEAFAFVVLSVVAKKLKYSDRPNSAQHRLLNTKVIIIIPLGMPTLCLYLLHTFSLILPKFYFVSSFYANVHAKMKIHFPKV